MVWVNEIPWYEMNVGDELTLRCRDPLLREIENALHREIYQWEHMQGCNVEIVIKYISTVRHDPRRLWQWAEIALVAARVAGGCG